MNVVIPWNQTYRPSGCQSHKDHNLPSNTLANADVVQEGTRTCGKHIVGQRAGICMPMASKEGMQVQSKAENSVHAFL